MSSKFTCQDFRHSIEEKILTEIEVEDEIRLHFHLDVCEMCRQEMRELEAVRTVFVQPIRLSSPSAFTLRRLERKAIKQLRRVAGVPPWKIRLIPKLRTTTAEAFVFAAILLTIFVDVRSLEGATIARLGVLLDAIQFEYPQPVAWQHTNGPIDTIRAPVGGFVWRPVINALATDSKGAVFAGTSHGRIFRLIDQDRGWEEAVKFKSAVACITIGPDGSIFAGTGHRLFRSTDGGNSWSEIGSPWFKRAFIACLAINSNGDVLAGSSTGVYRSTHPGGPWLRASFGLPTDSGVLSLTIDPTGNIFAGTDGAGVFRSTDSGDSWSEVNRGLVPESFGRVVALAVSWRGDVLAGVWGDGVYRSTDGGERWVAVNDGLTNRFISALVINSSGHIFVGTSGGGVFRSTDDAATWREWNIGLKSAEVYKNSMVPSLVVDPNGYVYAGTFQEGVFRTVRSTSPMIDD